MSLMDSDWDPMEELMELRDLSEQHARNITQLIEGYTQITDAFVDLSKQHSALIETITQIKREQLKLTKEIALLKR
jgi:hypothetical protein